ncbi:MAG: N-acetyl-gamma-glutamyl-phosphate reductase [bacterium]
MIRVSIIGATGYTGGELIKLLLRHPRVHISMLTSQSNAGKKISDIHVFLKGKCDIVCRKFQLDKLIHNSDVIFSCLPHGAVVEHAKHMLKGNKILIDLSADFRLKDAAEYKKWYMFTHKAQDLLSEAVYGLSELNRKNLKKAQLIANPGCYATACLLSLAPIIKSKSVVLDSIIIDAKSGVSGAGRKLNLLYHFAEANENVLAYKVAEHRHIPEIEQELSLLANHEVKITFVPHLIPLDRGIMVTCYTRLSKKMKADSIYKMYKDFYSGEPFIQVLPLGEFPTVKAVLNTNNCWIGLKLVEKTRELIIIGVLDNLLKGASGQAVQNMNIACGFQETVALL